MLVVEKILLSVNETNCYVAACATSKDTLIVDPGEYDDRIGDIIKEKGLTVRHIFVTHDHYDHTGGIDEVMSRFGGELLSWSGIGRGKKVKDGDSVPLGKVQGKVLFTPGHTADSISLVIGDHVFVGDAIFAGSVGGTSSREDHERLISAIRDQIFPLGDHIGIHTGHGPCTTVGIERVFNPFFHRQLT